MEEHIFLDKMKDILDEDHLLKLKKIINFCNEMKKENLFLTKISYTKINEKKNNISDYFVCFVNLLIDNISNLLIHIDNFNKNFFIQIVIGYLFKIITSNFNFFPSHKLIIIIFKYLCNSAKNFIRKLNFDKEIKEINNDLCILLNKFAKDENAVNNNFHENVENLKQFYEEEEYYKRPYFNKYLKIIDKKQDTINLYILLYYLNKNNYFNNNEKYKIKEIIESIEKEVKNNKVENNDVLNIINYSLKILNANSFEDIKKISDNLESKNIYKPKIIDCFENSDKYYRDLLNELFFKIKNLKKVPTIFNYKDKKNYWWCIIKLIEILIGQNDINNSIIKIIFYFIIKLLDEKLDFLIEKDFISNNLYTLLDEIFSKKKIILLYPEIACLLNDNKLVYNYFLTGQNEEIFYNILEDKLEEYQAKEFKQEETYTNLKDYKYKHFFISIIIEYLLSNYNLQMSDSILNYKFYKDKKIEKTSFNIFYNLYLNKVTQNEYQLIDLNTEQKKNDINNKSIYNYMKDIFNNKDFLTLIEKIIKSKVMDEAYKEIEQLDKKDKMKSSINDYNIYNYYLKFIKDLNEILEKKNIFILMKISKRFRGICFRFLKIIINTEDIVFINNNYNEEQINELLSAYLIFVIIHEFYNFLKRIYNINVDKEIAITPRENEGGKEIIKLLFNHYLLNRKIILSQAKYILNIKNWENKSLKDFKNDYLNIKTEPEDKSIVYLSTESEESDICYYGFIGPEK